jgi:hypothetical protein
MSELLDRDRSARRSLNVVETSSTELKEAAKAIDDLKRKTTKAEIVLGRKSLLQGIVAYDGCSPVGIYMCFTD